MEATRRKRGLNCGRACRRFPVLIGTGEFVCATGNSLTGALIVTRCRLQRCRLQETQAPVQSHRGDQGSAKWRFTIIVDPSHEDDGWCRQTGYENCRSRNANTEHQYPKYLNPQLSTAFATAPDYPPRLVGRRRDLKMVSPKSKGPWVISTRPYHLPGTAAERKAHGRRPICGGANRSTRRGPRNHKKLATPRR